MRKDCTHVNQTNTDDTQVLEKKNEHLFTKVIPVAVYHVAFSEVHIYVANLSSCFSYESWKSWHWCFDFI